MIWSLKVYLAMKKILLKITFNSALGLILVFIWSRFVSFAEILKVLKTVDLRFALLFFALFALSGGVRALRFKLLLDKYHLPFKDVLMLTYLGQFLSFLIPVRVGEMSKSVYLTSQFDLPLGKTITWVFVDRFMDFLGVLLFIAIFLLFIPTALPVNTQLGAFGLLFFFNLFFIFALKSENWIKKIMVFLSNFLVFSNIKKWFVAFTHNIIEGFEVLRREPKEIFVLLTLTFLALLSDSLAWLFVFKSLSVNLGVAKSILGNALIALTFLIPSAPGYVGSAESFGLVVFGGILGMEANATSAALVLFHILTLLMMLVLGVGSLYFLKFDLRLVWKKITGKDS